MASILTGADEMNILVQREPSKNGGTLGRLFIDNVAFCDTLEDIIREQKGTPVSEWKVFGRTAIPEGKYLVTFENSPKFGPNTMTVNDVDGFEKIRIHAGNTADDTDGCLLVGLRNTDHTIVESRKTLTNLKIKVLTACQNGEPVWIEYLNPLEVA